MLCGGALGLVPDATRGAWGLAVFGGAGFNSLTHAWGLAGCCTSYSNRARVLVLAVAVWGLPGVCVFPDSTACSLRGSSCGGVLTC